MLRAWDTPAVLVNTLTKTLAPEGSPEVFGSGGRGSGVGLLLIRGCCFTGSFQEKKKERSLA